MSLTRKRKRELKRLRSSAEELWEQQQELLERANAVAREIGRQVANLTREEVAPRVRDRYQQYLQPGVDNARTMARQAGHNLGPAVSGAVGTALSMADAAKDGGVKAALARFSAPQPAPKKSGPGIPTFVVGGFALAALAGLAYAVWQTFRADDELWVAEDTATTGTATPPLPAQ